MSKLTGLSHRAAVAYNLKGNTPKEAVKFFEEMSSHYEKDHERIDNKLHEGPVDLLQNVINSGSTDITYTSSILNLAAATGLIGAYLRSKGFKGPIDAHDGASSMLKIAKSKKDVYRNTYCSLIEPNETMPSDLSTGCYDVVLTSGSMAPFMIHYKSLKHFVNSVRVGGLILFPIARPINEERLEYYIGFERESYELEKRHIWKLLDVQFNPQYRNSHTAMDKIKKDRVPTSCINYCFKKLENLEML